MIAQGMVHTRWIADNRFGVIFILGMKAMTSKMPLILSSITVVFVVIGMLFMPADPNAPVGSSGRTASSASTLVTQKSDSPAMKPKEDVRPPGADDQPLPEGIQQVEVFWSGQWISATVLERNAGQLKVHVVGDKVNATIWVAESKVRRPQAAMGFTPGAAQSQ